MARLLIADDEGRLRRMLRMILEQEGHEIVEAEDGRYALLALEREGPFDVLLLDLMMPWVDGWDVLRNLGPSGPKVVVITSREDHYSEERAARSHEVFRYIMKPYDPEDVVTAVRDAVAGGSGTDQQP